MITALTRKTALNLIQGIRGQLFGAIFSKRTDGSIRQMVCRTGVWKHLKDKSRRDVMVYNGKTNLLLVWDSQCRGYRSIPLEGLRQLKVRGLWLEIIE